MQNDWFEMLKYLDSNTENKNEFIKQLEVMGKNELVRRYEESKQREYKRSGAAR